MRIETIPRGEFLTDRFWYRAGEHLTVLAPTDGGKTQLSYELQQVTASPQLPVVNLVMKPKDPVVKRWDKALGYKEVRHWGPPPSSTKWAPNKPPGWTLWPRHSFDPHKDDPMLWREFRAAILDRYKKGNSIVFADEILGLVDLGLEREINAVLTRARTMGTGLWSASQRPANIPLNCYSQASHIFLGRTPDERDRKRYGEIGGVDPQLIKTWVLELKRFQFLYIRRHGENGAEMCIVDKN